MGLTIRRHKPSSKHNKNKTEVLLSHETIPHAQWKHVWSKDTHMEQNEWRKHTLRHRLFLLSPLWSLPHSLYLRVLFRHSDSHESDSVRENGDTSLLTGLFKNAVTAHTLTNQCCANVSNLGSKLDQQRAVCVHSSFTAYPTMLLIPHTHWKRRMTTKLLSQREAKNKAFGVHFWKLGLNLLLDVKYRGTT